MTTVSESDSRKNMTSSQASCLLCLSMNKNTLNFYSDTGKEMKITSILSIHFWFTIDEINALPNICYECLHKIVPFHEFYESVQFAHKKFETVFVKVENEMHIEEDEETYQWEQVTLDKIKIENDLDIEDNSGYEDEEDESSNSSVWETTHINSIDTEIRAFDLLPQKTQVAYLGSYNTFLAWKSKENLSDEECFSEAGLLKYLYSLQPKNKPTTLRAHYSMIKTLIQRNHNIDISYPKITSFLKEIMVGFRSQRNVFQPDDLQRFFVEANDLEFLAVKVIMIFLVNGATRLIDFVTVTVNDVVEQGSVFVIKMPDPKTNGFRSFTVENEYAACVRKYKNLRPANVTFDRFFIKYQKGKCIAQPVGKNKFSNAPKAIAKFLNLKDVENYTCYSFCRDSIANRRKINSEPMNFERSTEAMVTSTITSSINSPTSIFPSTCNDARSIELLPEKSHDHYLRSYDKFMAWKSDRKISKESFSETVMLEYFHCMKTKLKPTSLWAVYSMLKATIQKNHDVDISYPGLRSFLKERSIAYLPRQCEAFRADEIQRFLCEAEDNSFLAAKVIMIFAIHGITKTDDLLNLDVNDVNEHGSVFVIKIPDTKTNGLRSITVQHYEYVAYVRKYIALRPENISHSYFFINFKEGICTVQPISKKKFLSTSKVIANFLNLDAKNYSLLSFHRKSLKRGKLLSSVIDNYTDESLPKKKKTTDVNSEQIKLEGPTEAITASVIPSSFSIPSTFPTTANQVFEDVEVTSWDLLPGKSREKYLRSYDNFMAWKTDENIDKECFSEAVMLKYFNYLKPKYKPTTLWSEYSKLKATIQKKHDADISHPEVKSFLKSLSSGYQPQKCNFFQPNEILRFLSEADDKEFLVIKITMIFGIYGISKAHELTELEAEDVIQEGSEFVVKIRNTKTNDVRSLRVEDKYAPYVQKYKQLRPENISLSRFFINYQKGKCAAQPIGKNRFTHMPKAIAKFLDLEDADNYTLKSFPIKICNLK